MIVPMKKASIIVRLEDAAEAVQAVRGLGVLHVEHTEAPQNRDVSALQEDLALLNTCLDALDQATLAQKGMPLKDKTLHDWRQAAQHIIDLKKRHAQLEAYSRALLHTISAWEDWGDFDPRQVQHLKEKGVFIRLYQVPERQIADFPADALVKVAFTAGGLSHCVVVSRTEFSSSFKELPLPKQGLAEMRLRLTEDGRMMESIQADIRNAAFFYAGFLGIRQKLEKEIEFQQAVAGMAKTGALTYITGYVPADKIGDLSVQAKEASWGLLLTEPSEGDNVPTLIRNPAWVSLIKPVWALLEIVPGYRELDISLPFLVFFSVFFGMLIGDAGYGTLYLLLAFWVKKRRGNKPAEKPIFLLFYLLSFCAIIWGLLTGAFFGQEWISKTGLKPLLPALNEARNIQTFCFFLGALHLSLAHTWRAILKYPSLTALADLGWVSVLWAAFLLAKTLILGDNFPSFGSWLIIAGITLVVLFTSPQKNIFKGIGAGLGTLALSLMNNFTDVVSYVRLFAVGLAGIAIADTFNAMSSGIDRGNLLALILSGLILLAGHGLNLVLGPMSVLVHGVRLNVLEFSGHANVAWSGFTYKPLRE